MSSHRDTTPHPAHGASPSPFAAVAGIAALVFAFLFITTCIRRRRAMKFDRDVAAAAAVAAAESQAIRPYDDDDDDVFTVAPRAQGGGYSYAPGKVCSSPLVHPYNTCASLLISHLARTRRWPNTIHIRMLLQVS